MPTGAIRSLIQGRCFCNRASASEFLRHRLSTSSRNSASGNGGRGAGRPKHIFRRSSTLQPADRSIFDPLKQPSFSSPMAETVPFRPIPSDLRWTRAYEGTFSASRTKPDHGGPLSSLNLINGQSLLGPRPMTAQAFPSMVGQSAVDARLGRCCAYRRIEVTRIPKVLRTGRGCGRRDQSGACHQEKARLATNRHFILLPIERIESLARNGEFPSVTILNEVKDPIESNT